FRPGERFGGQLRTALNHVRERHNAGERVIVISQQIDRLENIWYEQDASDYLPRLDAIEAEPEPNVLAFIAGELSEGWTLNTQGGTLQLITDAELFGWSRPEPRRRKSSKRGGSRLPESDY